MPLCPLRIMNSLEKRCCPHPHSHLHSHTRFWNVVLTINTVRNINHSLFTFFLYVPLLFADLSEWEDFVHSPHAGPVRIFFIVYFKNSVYLPDKYTYNVFGRVFFSALPFPSILLKKMISRVNFLWKLNTEPISNLVCQKFLRNVLPLCREMWSKLSIVIKFDIYLICHW